MSAINRLFCPERPGVPPLPVVANFCVCNRLRRFSKTRKLLYGSAAALDRAGRGSAGGAGGGRGGFRGAKSPVIFRHVGWSSGAPHKHARSFDPKSPVVRIQCKRYFAGDYSTSLKSHHILVLRILSLWFFSQKFFCTFFHLSSLWCSCFYIINKG